MNVEIVDTLGHYFFEVQAIDTDGQLSNIVSTDGFSFDLDKPVLTSILILMNQKTEILQTMKLSWSFIGQDLISSRGFEYQYIFTDTTSLI